MPKNLPQPLMAGLVTIATLTWPLAAIATALETLPVINGIRPGQVYYVRSETQARPEIERAILAVLPDPYLADLPARDRLRYYYNRIDLNGDRRLETIVYVVGRSTCGREGCLALIFTQSRQGLHLVSQFTAVHAPILVLKQKTLGWNDLVFFTAGGDSPPRYKRVQFDGQTYGSPPVSQAEVAANTSLRGTAILADLIRLTNGLPLRSLAELPTPAPRPDSLNWTPEFDGDGEATSSVGQQPSTSQPSP